MKDTNKVGAAAIWMLMPTLGGLLAFTALGWYPYLLASAVTGFIAWEMLCERRSRTIFLGCAALAASAGMLAQWWFLSPEGSLAERGIGLIVFPALLVLAFFSMKIYSIESGKEDARARGDAE